MSLPYLREFGWEATVLAVKPDETEGAMLDPLLESTGPADADMVRVTAISAVLTRRIGAGSLALRSFPFLWRAGAQLLRAGNFDLVYFSTTQFLVTVLGPLWKRKFGVPYVVDFQDPWLDDYYARTGTPPPGGRFRYSFSRGLARVLEPRVMRNVSQVTAVSPIYAETLKRRYQHLREDQFTVLPIGVAEDDFRLVSQLRIQQSIFASNDGKQHWVYVGAAGKIMATSLRILFSSLGRLRREDSKWNSVRLHFVGTSYAPAHRAEQTVMPIATNYGVADMVEEQTTRAPYFESLRLLQDADAILVVGSDSAAYNPSKLATYVFARKPLLAILHHDSPGIQFLRRSSGANLVTFLPANPNDSLSEAAQALQQTFVMAKAGLAPDVDQKEMANYGAREMTRRLCEVFEKAVKRPQR